MKDTDRPLLGIALMLAFCVLAPFADALSKILSATQAVFVIVLARFVAQVVLLVPFCARLPRPLLPRQHRLTLLIRAILHIAGIGMMFVGLRHLPLADAIAIAFVMPFIMLLLGWRFLGESVGPARLAACAVGFCGTLMVVQPAFAAVGWPALMPLGVAVIFALFMLQTRKLAKDVGAIPLQFLSGVVACAILIPVLILGNALDIADLRFDAIPQRDWILLMATGAIGTLAHLFMTWSLRYAPSTTLAPMQYLEIPCATLVGFLIFSDLPNGLAAIGIIITMAAGLFVIWREQFRQRQAQPAPAQEL